MKYKFRSEGLLKLRKFKEHKEKIQLAELNRLILKAKENIDQAREEIKIAHEGRQAALEERDKNYIIHFYPAFIEGRQIYIKQQEDHLKGFQEELEKKTQKFVQLRSQLKLVEKWKEKDFLKFKQENQKKIESEVEDIIMAREINEKIVDKRRRA